MKTKITLAFMLCLGLVFTNAKAQDFEEEELHVSLGYGFGTFTGSYFSLYKDLDGYSQSATGPLYAKVEYAMSDKIGMGLNLAYVKHELSYNYYGIDSQGNDATYTETDEFSSLSALLRINWHFGELDNFDPYWGIGLGYRTGKWSYSSTDPDGTNSLDVSDPFPFGFETTVGCRWHMTDNFGLYVETGLAKSVLQFGITNRF